MALPLLFLCGVAVASSPELNSVSPAGAQRGTDIQFTFSGARLEDAQAVLFYRSGITVKSFKVENAGAVKVDCAIAPDCPLGEHPLRLRTVTGVTELRTVYVGALPIVAEVEPNNDFAAPQTISLNATVAGVITNEDVDYFAVQAKAGQRITAEIEALRLGRAMFDPYVAILDARRFELAASDDSALLLQDSVASAVAPADGVYIVQVREASYGGGDAYHYRLHVGTFPRPLAVFPPGGAPGEKIAAQFLGDVLGAKPAEITLPGAPAERWPVFAQDEQGSAPSPNWLRVVALPNVVESQSIAGIQLVAAAQPATATQPAATTQPAPAQTVTTQPAPPEVAAPPVAFNGILDAPGQVDAFRFKAAKGQQLDVNVFARRLRSPLDSVLEVLDAAGKTLASNDDAVGPDSYLRFGAPADGEYAVRVRDQRGRGGLTFAYRVEIDQVRPDLALTLERVDSRRPQFLQAVAVPRGNRFAVLFRVDRKDCGGAAALEAAGLPAGVTLAADGLAANLGQWPVVFEVAPDAPLDGGLFDFRARLKQENSEIVGGFRQIVPLVISAPNDTVYYQTSADRLAVAVTEPVPFKIQLVPPPAGVLRNGAAQLKVLVERAEGFTGEIVVQMLWNPPGVSSVPSITIPNGPTEATYPINAAGDAPLTSYKIALLAHANLKDGERWVSSQLADLTVGDVFMNGALQLAAVEQGKAGGIACKVEQKRPFEGKARVTLLGLPAKIAAAPVEVSPTDAEIVFPLTVEADAPVGQHGGLVCELAAMQNGAPVTHRFAMNGALRIDAPRVVAAPPPVAQPPPPPAEAKPAPPKPLSRLEQLRKEAAERAGPNAGEPPKSEPGKSP